MAEIKRSPWLIFPSDDHSPVPLKRGWVAIDSFVWSEYSDPAHRVRLVDYEGRDVFNVTGSTDMGPIIFTPGVLSARDLQVVEMPSGVLYIYIK